jgi:hypothetical protein
MPTIPALRRLRQEHNKFEASLGYTEEITTFPLQNTSKQS